MHLHDYRLIARNKRKGVSNRQIAQMLGISRNTVNRIVREIIDADLSWIEVGSMSDEQLKERFSPGKVPSIDPGYEFPDYQALSSELSKPGVTLQLLWEEYVDRCRLAGKKHYQLTQFKKHFHSYLSNIEFTDIIHHKAGERTEVDWAGTRPHWTDPDTGETIYGYLFVGILSFSGYAFAKVCSDMKLNNWVQCHIDMFRYFGGVTQILVPDNLKTGVTKHGKDQIVLNPTYEEMAEHYGIVVIPTRVRRPKDKPLVENTVGKLTTYIIARLRNYQFFSMDEYNQQLGVELERFNERPFQKKEGSRRSIFEEMERSALRPLPAVPYEIGEWRKAKVQNNSHICVNKNYYSVPYLYLGKEVDVKLTRDRLSIYHDHHLLCEHPRIHYRTGSYETDISHMPPNSCSCGDWNSARYLNWAKKKGPYTYQVIYALFSNTKIEQRYYRTAHSILKLADTYSDERLEAACKVALELFQTPRYKNVKHILESHEDQRQEERKIEQRYLRGGSYFGKR